MSLKVIPVPGPGAEDVVVGLSGPDEGAVFTGTEDGSIFRISHDGGKVDRIAQTQGRPLGIEIDLDGRLLVCDAHKGLLRIDTASGAIEAVTDKVNGTAMKFCNNAAIASDGTVWFSDSSTKYGIEQWKHDFVRNTRTGRLMRMDPDGTVTVVHRRARLRQRGRAVEGRGLRVRRRDRRPHRRTSLDHRQPRRHARPALLQPAGLSRQHRAGERRADLGHPRQPQGPRRRAAAARPDAAAPPGHRAARRRCSPSPR